MDAREGRGSFIDGRWVQGGGAVVESFDPARDFERVFQTTSGAGHVDAAVAAAQAAQPRWAGLSAEARLDALDKLRAAFDAHAEVIASAIVYETGKPHREAVGEAKSLGARVKLMAEQGMKRVHTLHPEGVEGYARAHPQGVVAVIGPYNYPAHLLNAHVVPALMTGNAVVIKPTEYCPWVGQLYAECFEAAGLPPGVVGMLQGAADTGRALVEHPGVHAILFTGSWATGQAIARSCLERPEKLAALEMGGKNCAVILDDADLHQALAAVTQGAFLSAGQRCTATSRVLVERRVAERFLDALAEATRRLRPGDPWAEGTAFGPLANRPALERFSRLRAGAAAAGAEVLVAGEALGGGAFVTPSLHRLPDGETEAPGYLDEELFGPDLCAEVVDDVDHAIERINASPYGLSNAVFTADEAKFEQVFLRTRSGLLNKNRSTNGASGLLPFGGVGKSGNQRPAGIEAMRYTTFPVAVMEGAPGEAPVESAFVDAVRAGEDRFRLDLDHLRVRHEIEVTLERYCVQVDDVAGPEVHVALDTFDDWSRDGEPVTGEMLAAALGEGASIRGHHLVLVAPRPQEGRALLDRLESLLVNLARNNPQAVLGHPAPRVSLPEGGRLPRSEAWLRRLYRGDFVPREKKTAVVDHGTSLGPFLRSVDDPPLGILDAASQIASVGTGYSPGHFFAALDEGRLTEALLANPDTTLDPHPELDAFGKFLLSHTWQGIKHATWTHGGSEANERALDLCRLNGPGGRRVITFEGSFHGRTLIPLFATSNPTKRKAFEFDGYEARWVPFPNWLDPRVEPEVTDEWIKAWARGEAPEAWTELEEAEVASLLAVKKAVEEGDVCAVIVEPMQGEGGDNYATARFFQGLRALTRGLGVPLIFDEVQTGFGLGGPFFWHQRFALRDTAGRPDGPDCVTSAKKAQVGVCLSRWPDPRPAPAHLAQAIRGHIHGREIVKSTNRLEHDVRDRLWRLALAFPGLVLNPRNRGWAFAFDLPSPNLALQVVNQRFYRGFMVYIAGERTVRFRLNTAWTPANLDRLFSGVKDALQLLVEATQGTKGAVREEREKSLVAPRWVDTEPVRSPGHQASTAERLDDDGPALMRWLLSLPPGALERVCDRLLGRDGQLPSARVNEALARLLGEDDLDAGPAAVIKSLQRRWQALGAKDDEEGAYERLDRELGLDPCRLLAEALGARLYTMKRNEWARFRHQIVAIENATYEVGRRETEEELRAMVEGEGGLGILVLRRSDDGQRVLGYAFGGPVEQYQADGPRDDAMNGWRNTFYSSNITVAADARGAGLGQRLKQAQLEAVQALEDGQGGRRYDYITSRNRVGRTEEMSAINRSLGSYVVDHFAGNQYGDTSGEALYLRIPFRRPRVLIDAPEGPRPLHWGAGVQMPLGDRPAVLFDMIRRGELTGPVGTKLTLSNWTTPALVRYAEVLRALSPRGLAHTYFTSGQAELVDKGLRCLRLHRPGAQRVITLERQFVGTTTAASRSLTDPAGQQEPFGWFDWPRVPHPAEVGSDASLGAILALVNQLGKDDVLGIVVELVGERSGLVVPDEFLKDLDVLRKDTGIPLVFVETASGLGRTSKGASLWRSDERPVSPDMIWWYAGAQLGHIFVTGPTYVDKPLTLISTWDGDEICALRTQAHLLEARRLLGAGRPQAFAKAVQDASLGVPVAGAGLWQVLDLGDEARSAAVGQAAAAAGLRLGRGLPGRLVLAPPLDVTDEEIGRGLDVLKKALRG